MTSNLTSLALAKTVRGSTQLNRAAQQLVPAFLQKLYEIINDETNADLIRWSDGGDALIVLDHERFARDLLGRWFKHQNFNSFVRQLNMYGFRKVSHLQQGSLRSPVDVDNWCFEHPCFRRGQPDLLCLMQRKKHSASTSIREDSEPPIIGDPNDQVVAERLGALQLQKMQIVLDQIAGIERHQAAISADLGELKRSNQVLWQEATAARLRLEKQQDTINRIVRFLAGVFGNQSDGNIDEVADQVLASPNSSNALGLMVGRIRPRLSPPVEGPTVVGDIPEITTSAHQQYGATRSYAVKSPESLIAELPSQPDSGIVASPISPLIIPPSFIHEPSDIAGASQTSSSITSPLPITPDSSAGGAESMLQAFQRMMGTPPGLSQPHRLALKTPGPRLGALSGPYDNAAHDSVPVMSSPAMPYDYGSGAESILEGIPINSMTQRLLNDWKASADIDKDVAALQTNISSLMDTLGLQPTSDQDGIPSHSFLGDLPDALLESYANTLGLDGYEPFLAEYLGDGSLSSTRVNPPDAVSTPSSSSLSGAASPLTTATPDGVGENTSNIARGEKRRPNEHDDGFGPPIKATRASLRSRGNKGKRRAQQ